MLRRTRKGAQHGRRVAKVRAKRPDASAAEIAIRVEVMPRARPVR